MTTCDYCGKEFEEKPRQKYCSRECCVKQHNIEHNAMRRERNKSHVPEVKICPVCNQEFKPASLRQVYCTTPECKQKRWMKNNAYIKENKVKPVLNAVCPFCQKEYEKTRTNQPTCGDIECVHKHIELKQEEARNRTERVKRFAAYGQTLASNLDAGIVGTCHCGKPYVKYGKIEECPFCRGVYVPFREKFNHKIIMAV